MKTVTISLLLIITLVSCSGGETKSSKPAIKVFILIAVAGVSVLIKNLRDSNDNKTYEAVQVQPVTQNETSEVPTIYPVAGPLNAEASLMNVRSTVFNRRTIILPFALIPIFPLLIALANPGLGMGLFFVFTVIALIGGYTYNQKIQGQNYKKIEVLEDRLMFYWEDYSDGEVLFFHDIKRLSFRNNYETTAHGIEKRDGTNMTFYGDDSKVRASVDYKKYKDSDLLKELILKRLKMQ